ncbi:MAG: TPM domain-containing protein [candidate division NC10 bacterium]|nr:TPM domain-containing protein [candidate division NC10 bacterium]MBI4840665.1 TPM domain-containing protein [candidate division NC10 bacterium]
MALFDLFRRRFLTAVEREQIEIGLAEAGRHTRARIGLSIDERAGKDPQARAQALFRQWDLPEDERPTAVLVYVSAPSRTFAIVGGEEVRRAAPQTFWEAAERDFRHHFAEGRYCDGIFKALAQVALELERLFPRGREEAAGGRPNTSEDPVGNPNPTDRTA